MTCPIESLRIGGELELSASIFKDAVNTDRSSEHDFESCIWTDTGRSALFLAATAILFIGGKPRVWIPAYSCESISKPFLQMGFEIRYYCLGSRLGYDSSVLPEPLPGETLLFIHYFGHYNARMAAAARQYRANGIWVVEDCVQFGLSSMVGKCGDFAVTSYRKVLPVVDGAALLCQPHVDLSLTALKLAQVDESFISPRLLGKILRGFDAGESVALTLLEFSENRIQDSIIPREISWFSSWMLKRLDWDTAISRRRANWVDLLGKMKHHGLVNAVQPVFDSLGHHDVPLGLLVRVAGSLRDDLRLFLAERQIYCPVHWPVGHLPQNSIFQGERDFSSNSLTFPVDQRMAVGHIDRFISALNSFFNKA